MIYNFPELKDQNEWLESGLQLLKKEYQKLRMPEEQYQKLQKKMKEADMEIRREKKKAGMIKFTAAAALIAGFVALPNTSAEIAHAMEQIPVVGQLVETVTFRDYKYDSDKNSADVKVPEIKPAAQADGSGAQKALERTAEEINGEIQEITDRMVDEFKENLAQDGGYQDIKVDSRVLAAAEDYFTLQLSCYQAAGSGYQSQYYYTIDLNTGRRLHLKDIFKDGADYITPISRNIKKQMRQQMKADENVVYWLDNEVEDWNFKKITEETSFYLNDKDQLVICFNEGDAAPMYMGPVEFEIPADVLDGIRK